MKPHTRLFLTTVAWVWIVTALVGIRCAAAQVSKPEREALLALYENTGGVNWRNNSGWGGPPGTECEWYGVTCRDGHVVELNLSANGLAGPLPEKMGNLTHLSYLVLDTNRLSGNIPPELGRLTNLRLLSLSANQLTGGIPSELGNLIKLTDLYLSDNRLTGDIPPELGNLVNLELLSLTSNQLTGEIPPALSDLTGLTRLY
jgi:Leucine-rich repeat (LRR) protein